MGALGRLLVLICIPVFASQALPPADPAMDASEYHEFLRANLPAPMQDQINLSMIHMLPDSPLRSLTSAPTVDDAMTMILGSTLGALIANTRITPAITLSAAPARPLTLVVVPGMFAEFLPERPFEESLARVTPETNSFRALVAAAASRHEAVAFDETRVIGAMKKTVLSDLVTVTALPPSATPGPARLIFLAAPKGSGESLGSLDERAMILNRRLEKFLALTGEQDLVFVGPDEGTAVALEMMARAQADGAAWLPKARAVVSWAGSVWGDPFADEALTPGTPSFKVMTEIRRLRAALDPASPEKTSLAWKEFQAALARLETDLTAGRSYPAPADLNGPPRPLAVDGLSLGFAVRSLADAVEPFAAKPDTAARVARFGELLDRLLISVEGLGTTARTRWWTTAAVPLQTTYYSLSAAAADPTESELAREAFEGGWGYAGSSFDDLFWLQNQRDTKTRTGVSLNDGRSAIPQSTFLPIVIAGLNPANDGLRAVSLGYAGTHHSGMVYGAVNPMKDGRRNPFPREALLRSLADKVSLDRQRAPTGGAPLIRR